MSTRSAERLRQRYYRGRAELEAIPLRLLSVGELAVVLELLSERSTPKNFEEEEFALRKLREIESMLRSIRSHARETLK